MEKANDSQFALGQKYRNRVIIKSWKSKSRNGLINLVLASHVGYNDQTNKRAHYGPHWLASVIMDTGLEISFMRIDMKNFDADLSFMPVLAGTNTGAVSDD